MRHQISPNRLNLSSECYVICLHALHSKIEIHLQLRR